MKKCLLIFLSISAMVCMAQTDSTLLRNRNVLSLEWGGGSYGLYHFAAPLNLGYAHIYATNRNIKLSARIGIMTGRNFISSAPDGVRLWIMPLELGMLIGQNHLWADIGVGHTSVFGKQYIQVINNSTPAVIPLSYYEFWTGRIGVCLLPIKKYGLYMRIAWTPAYVPMRFPIQDGAFRLVNGRNDHWWIARGSLAIGFTF